LWPAAALLAVFSILAGSTLAVARQQRPLARLERLRLAECPPPCWLGIQPGLMSLDEAQARVLAAYSLDRGYLSSARERSPNSRSFDRVVTVQSLADPGFAFMVELDSYDGRNDLTVRSLAFHFSQSQSPTATDFTLYVLISALGHPSSVRVSDPRFGYLLVRYDMPGGQGVFLTSPVNRRLDGNDMAQMRFYAGGRFVNAQFDSNAPWRGFAALGMYLQNIQRLPPEPIP
jgi:hypothetical protein